MYPVKDVYVTTPFGKPGNLWMAGKHTGTDFRAAVGTPIYATKGGKVIHAGYGGYGSSYGNHVIISSLTIGGYRTHLYAHLSSTSVRYGQRVATGQIIGRSGQTGHAFGPHLHYEERTSPYNYWAYSSPKFLATKVFYKPTVRLSNVRPGKKNRDVARVQRKLNRYMDGPNLKVTGYFGTATRNRYKKWQKHLGYKGNDANGVPGRSSLARLNLNVK